MNPSRIEKAIDDIYDYVESCKASKLYPNKVLVERVELYDLLDDLRMCAPDEIKRYQKIIKNQEGILNQAQQKAEDMVTQARQKTAQILDQNEIVQTAYQRAEEIMKQATQEAMRLVNAAHEECEQMRRDSLVYTNNLLAGARQSMDESLHETDNKYRMLTSALKNGIQVIRKNQEELMMKLDPEQNMMGGQAETAAAETGGGNINVPENADLENAKQQ